MDRAKVGTRGFTLIELVVTLLVLGVAVAVVTPTIGRSTENLRARAQVSRLTAMLRHAREQAITTRRAHSLVVDQAGHRLTIVSGDQVETIRALPADLIIEASPPPALTVRFEPYGVSNGGDFRVTSGTVRYRVIVDGLTGYVRATRE
jgi:prepilin-type N-terminal cleavage/methylation domain-containing protein